MALNGLHPGVAAATAPRGRSSPAGPGGGYGSQPHQMPMGMGVSPQPSGPPGALQPGTLVRIGPYTVTVKRYLSQGGFAAVYLATTDRPVAIPEYGGRTARNETTHVLKRIVVPDKDTLAEVKREVEVHRMLRHDPSVVFFLEASALSLPPPQQGYEVYILMEYCNGGGLLDLLNARLRNRLTEVEVLNIFADVCKGVSAMHHLDPPIMHRDLKIENILLSKPTPSHTIYKLCDFGSAKPILSRRPPRSMDELKRLEMDLNKSTTLPYRPPEMVDVYQRRVIDEKADIWALGVLLYKLCYYTTPFEENGGGPLAILNVKYRFPSNPPYSDRMKGLIASLLTDPSTKRPSIDILLINVHKLLGTSPPQSALHYAQLAQQGKQSQPLPKVVDDDVLVRVDRKAVDDDILVKVANSRQQAREIKSPHSASSSRPMSMAGGSSSSSGNDLITFQSDSNTNTAAESKRLMELEGVKPMRRGRPAAGAGAGAGAGAVGKLASAGTSGSTNAIGKSASAGTSGSTNAIGKLDLSKFESSSPSSQSNPPVPSISAPSHKSSWSSSSANNSVAKPSSSMQSQSQSQSGSEAKVGTLLEGFGDSFEPDPPASTSPPLAGTTAQGTLAVPPSTSTRPKSSSASSTVDAPSSSSSPLKLSPALPGLSTPATKASSPPTTNDTLPSHKSDDSAEGRFPSLEELDKRYPSSSSSNQSRSKVEGLARASTISAPNSSASTSFSKARYDEARKTLGKRESLANIAGRFGGLNVHSSGSGGNNTAPAVPSKPSVPPASTGSPPVTASGKEDRPTPSLPPRKPVPKDWLEPSSNGSTYKSPARYGSKPPSPAIERKEEEIVSEPATAAADLEIAQSDNDAESSASSEGPEDLDSHPAAEARKRWTLSQQQQRQQQNGAESVSRSSEGYDMQRPADPVARGEQPGKIKAPQWLTSGQSDGTPPSSKDIASTAAELRAPAWDSSPSETPSQVKSPERLVDISSDDISANEDFAPPSTRSPQPINLLEEEEKEEEKVVITSPPLQDNNSSSKDSASKGLPSRQRREMGKVYNDAGTSPASFSNSRVASPAIASATVTNEDLAPEMTTAIEKDSATDTPKSANEPARYARGTAQSMASRWESIGGGSTSTTSASKPTSVHTPKPTSTSTPAVAPAPIASRPRPPQIPSKPPSLKPWEKEAAERLAVEKHGHLRSSSPSTPTEGTAESQQQRYQSVASLIDKWQASSKSAKPASGWGEIGNGNSSRLPGRDV
ncbi:unnamed protein product [Sympodiomycopsis kandeliae]